MTVSAPDPPDVQTLSRHRVALVTGSSRGLGRAIAIEFGQAGWRVGVHYRERRHDAEHTAAMVVAAGGEPCVYGADLRHSRSVHTMVEEVIARWGRLDVLVCSAATVSNHLTIRHPEAAWLSVIETNLTGIFHCLQATGPRMIAQGEGSVVLLGSLAALQGRPGQAAYAASKAGLLGLLKTVAQEWGRHGIRINALLPGWHRTELAGSAFPEGVGTRPGHVLNRLPDIDEVARTVYHLALLPGTSGQVWNLDSRIM